MALAKHLLSLGNGVMVFDRNPEVLRLLSQGVHPYIEGISFPPPMTTDVLKEAIGFSDYLVLALPVQVIGQVLKGSPLKGKKVISASKGLEIGTYRRVSQVIKDLEDEVETFCLSGPSFASEVSKGLPTALVLAGERLEELKVIRDAISSENFRVYLSTDLVGVELGGAIKNVIAIACGISDGLCFGENARAALMTRGLAEMVRIGLSLGARRETFYGLSGMGDLFLTASSTQSRNRTFGYLLGRGLSVKEAIKEIGQTVEGLYTAKALYQLSEEKGLHAPISKAVYRVVVEGQSSLETALELLRVPPQRDFEFE